MGFSAELTAVLSLFASLKRAGGDWPVADSRLRSVSSRTPRGRSAEGSLVLPSSSSQFSMSGLETFAGLDDFCGVGRQAKRDTVIADGQVGENLV